MLWDLVKKCLDSSVDIDSFFSLKNELGFLFDKSA